MTTTNPQSEHDPTPLSEQATHWWVVLNDEDCTVADRQAFAAWVQRSPERVESFLRMNVLDGALNLGDVRWPDVSADELIAQARNASADVVSLPLSRSAAHPAALRSRSTSKKRNLHMLLTATAATLCIGVLAVWLVLSPSRYATGIGEQRSVVLDDGSLVTLNTSSQIEVKYAAHSRFIRLVRGEALFEVAHDEARPFEVSVGKAVVRAVGTQFNIDRRTDHATVTVVEGRVKVTAQHEDTPGVAGSGPSLEPVSEVIAASQRVVVTQSNLSPPEQIADLAPVMAWTQRQLVFENRPLREVAEEFNRYNRHRIVIESGELQSQQVTGVFQANDPESFLAFVSGVPGVRIRTAENGDHVVYMNSSQTTGQTTGGPN